MFFNILKKEKNKDNDIKTHYPKCPNCGNEKYKKLIPCYQCNKLLCDTCKENHW